MFDREYWRSSAEKLKSVRYLALMAAFIAMKTIVSGIYIPISENLRIGISFVFVCVEAAIIGPVAGMVSGAVTDIVSFMIWPNGAFFVGYTITAMAGSLCYALFLYRKKITILRLIGAKLIANYLINVLMGSLWSAMLYSKGYIYYAGKSLIKNTLMLPVEVIILTAVFNLLLPVLQNRKLIVPQNPLPLKFR